MIFRTFYRALQTKSFGKWIWCWVEFGQYKKESILAWFREAGLENHFFVHNRQDRHLELLSSKKEQKINHHNSKVIFSQNLVRCILVSLPIRVNRFEQIFPVLISGISGIGKLNSIKKKHKNQKVTKASKTLTQKVFHKNSRMSEQEKLYVQE